MSGLYAADGSWNISVVSGSSLTGLYAADGSINVVISPGGGQVGLYAPCGAYYVTVSPGTFVSRYALDGSLYVQETITVLDSGQNVTVVSGTLHPGGGGSGAFIPLFY